MGEGYNKPEILALHLLNSIERVFTHSLAISLFNVLFTSPVLIKLTEVAHFVTKFWPWWKHRKIIVSLLTFFFLVNIWKKKKETGNHQVLGNQLLLNLIFSVKNWYKYCNNWSCSENIKGTNLVRLQTLIFHTKVLVQSESDMIRTFPLPSKM